LNDQPLYMKSGVTFVLGPNASSGILSVFPGLVRLERGGPQLFRRFYRVGEIVDTHRQVVLRRVRLGLPGTLTNLLVVGKEHAAIASLPGREWERLESALGDAGFKVSLEVRWVRRGRGRTF
jgi:hypothetical protein